MPRKNPIPKEAMEQSCQLLALRKTFHLSGPAFAEIVGANVNLLASYEHARNPWNPRYLSSLKRNLQKHLERCRKALEELPDYE